MRGRAFVVIVVVAITSSLLGCHGGDVADAPSTTDSGADAAADANDADAALDAGVNILDDPDFEDPSCSLWGGGTEASTHEVDGVAHSGTKSCMVCGNDPHPVWGIDQKIDKAKLVDGVSYSAAAWVRAPDGDAAPPLDGAFINLSIYKTDGTEIGTQSEAGPVTLDATWRQITVTRAWDATGDILDMSVLARSSGGCFLVDDATLARAP